MDRRNFLQASAAFALHSGLPFPLKELQGSVPIPLPDNSLRDKLMHDPLRPQYHLLPQAGSVGDPCAPRFFRGEYHAFFHGNFGGRGWAHAISSDLVHWRHMPIALSPTAGSYDAYGTFTGGVLPGGEGASIIYTGVTKVPREQETIRAEGLREVQCIATSMDDDLRTWKKRDKPVIDGPPPGLKITGFRDPFSWKDGDTWYVGVGSGFPQTGGAVLLYRSVDTLNWEYLHPLAQGTWNGQSFSNPVPSGEMWECPDFFPLGDKHVLLYSTEYTTRWEVGTYDKLNLRFHSEKRGLLDHGAYYAPRSMSDGNNRRILWGWVQETRSRTDIEQAGWSGSISLPRVLTLGMENDLQMEVAPEFASLRQSTIVVKEPRNSTELSDALSHATIHNRAAEISCTFKARESICGLELQLQSGTGTTSLFTVAYSQANGAPFVAIGDKLLPLSPDRDGLSTLHLWIDGSVIETFIDKRQVVTTRCYAAPAGPAEIRVVWNGASNLLKNLNVSAMGSISSDRLTT
jgi:beta-fructofuranosidase